MTVVIGNILGDAGLRELQDLNLKLTTGLLKMVWTLEQLGIRSADLPCSTNDF